MFITRAVEELGKKLQRFRRQTLEVSRSLQKVARLFRITFQGYALTDRQMFITRADIKRVEELGKKLQQFRRQTLEVARSLQEVARQFRTTFQGLKKADIVGSSAGLLGGILAAVGFGLSFTTFGASLLLTSVGAGICGVGGIVTGVTAITEFFQLKKAVEQTEKLIKVYEQTRRNILTECAEISEKLHPVSLESRFPLWASFFSKLVTGFFSGSAKIGWSVTWNTIHNVASAIKLKKAAKEIVIGSCATGGKITAASVKATTAVAKGFHIAGGMVGIAMIPLNIGVLVHYCNAVSTDKWPETSRQINEIADKLMENCPDESDIIEMINETVRILERK